jgi:hypothetical protein
MQKGGVCQVRRHGDIKEKGRSNELSETTGRQICIMLIKQRIILLSAIAIFLACISNMNTVIADQPDVDFIVTESIRRFEQVHDFTCTLEKKVNKKGVLYYDPEIIAKCKKPAHYYFKWEREGLKDRR